jgi:hypothetical protein
MHIKSYCGNLNGRDHLGDLGIIWKNNIKIETVWTAYSLLKISSCDRFHKKEKAIS